MRSERLPFRKCTARRLNRRINVGRRALGDGRNLLSGSRIVRIEKRAVGGLAPRSLDEVAETPLMAVQPEQRLLWIFRRRAVFHGEEFVSDAHSIDFTLLLVGCGA
jgi:hypothetical protein